MRSFEYILRSEKLLSPKIVMLLNQIHEYKGKQDLFIEANKDVLSSLVDVAKIQSTDASNRIEGIFTSDARLRALVNDKVEPRNRNESEIAGYRDVLGTIHDSYEYINVTSGVVLQLHRNLYNYSGYGFGGRFKNADNVIEEKDGQGDRFIRFQPMAAFETPEAVERICKASETAIQQNTIDPLLIIPLFILDFLCIHPFNDGNGRMSRLLTLLLLYKNGYIVGKYISFERIIEQTKETYYDTLQESSQEWHEGDNNDSPFVEYTLAVILSTYKEFASRVEYLNTKGYSKPERIRLVIKNHIGQITKKEIAEFCPDISVTLIEATLSELVKSDVLTKIGGGRFTSYVYNNQ